MRERGVLVLHNVPDVRQGVDLKTPWGESDAGVLGEVEAIQGALRKLKIPTRIADVRRLTDIVGTLASGDEPVVFNLVETLTGDPFDYTHVPEICKAMGKGCTGNDAACQALCLDKWRTKAVLKAHAVPTPDAVLVPLGMDVSGISIPPGPLIVKPLCADGSEGIDALSVVEGAGEPLDAAIRLVHSQFFQPAMVESYIDGREINVSMMQRGDQVDVLPLSEIEFTDYPAEKPRIVGYAAKWLSDSFEYRHTPRRMPAPMAPEVESDIRRLALAAWHAVGCRDYVRVDFRLDLAGRPFVLEINPNPDVSFNDGFAAAIKASGRDYPDFVAAMIENASARMQMSVRRMSAVASLRPSKNRPLSIRRAAGDDRKAILSMVVESGFFRPDEIAVAREVLDDSLTRGDEMGYYSYTAEMDGKPAGWVCFGPTACTVGTYDIYWIVVSPDCQRTGIGSALLDHAENLIARQGGRVTVIETSGRPMYRSTRCFYEKRGYRENARLPDFYAPGDDKLVFTKTLGPSG